MYQKSFLVQLAAVKVQLAAVKNEIKIRTIIGRMIKHGQGQKVNFTNVKSSTGEKLQSLIDCTKIDIDVNC